MKKLLLIVLGLLCFMLPSCELKNQGHNDKKDDDSTVIVEPSSDPTEDPKDDPNIDPIDPPDEVIDDDLGEHEINFATSIDQYYLYDEYLMYDGKNNIPLYNCKTNYANTWSGEANQRMNNAVGIIELKGSVKLSVKTKFKVSNFVTVRPLNKEVQYETSDYQIDFIIKEAGKYTIEFSNKRTLHLFVYEMEEINLEDYLYFAPGIHNKDNDSNINSSGQIVLKSNQKIYLALGAIVEARVISNNTNNIEIAGRGIIAGAKFDRSVFRGTTFIPFDFQNINGLKIRDISCLDPAGWCYNIYFCNNVNIDGVNVISSRSNGDGISIQSCQNVLVKNVFVRSWDDSIVVKNYPLWSNRDVEGQTRNIVVKDSLIWTDLAQSLEIGYECVGAIMEDIHFENIVVLHNYHKAVISIHNANNANIKNVSYKNIIIEDAAMGRGDGLNVVIDIRNIFNQSWSTNHKITSMGFISDISIEDIYVYNAYNTKIIISGMRDYRQGFDSSVVHDVVGVTIKNLYINEEKIDSNYPYLEMNEYVSNIVFE